MKKLYGRLRGGGGQDKAFGQKSFGDKKELSKGVNGRLKKCNRHVVLCFTPGLRKLFVEKIYADERFSPLLPFSGNC